MFRQKEFAIFYFKEDEREGKMTQIPKPKSTCHYSTILTFKIILGATNRNRERERNKIYIERDAPRII